MDDAYGCEEYTGADEAAQISANGNYLCVQYEGRLRYVYERVRHDRPLHPLINRQVYAGQLYSLVWVDDD